MIIWIRQIKNNATQPSETKSYSKIYQTNSIIFKIIHVNAAAAVTVIAVPVLLFWN